MKKLLFLGPAFEHHKGGAEYQYKILEEFLSDKYDIYYLFRHYKKLREKKYINYDYILRKNWNSNIYTDAYVIYKLIKNLAPDIIYKQGINYITAIGVFYAKRHKKKMIVKISSLKDVEHGNNEFGVKRIFRRLDSFIAGYVINNVDKIIYQAEYQNKILKVNFGRSGNLHMPNFHPITEKRKKQSKTIKIVWIANFKRLKKPEIFINLAEKFINKKNTKFIMIGRPEKSAWQKNILYRMKKLRNLEYLNELNIDEVNDVLDGAHILVNTSDYEGFPNTYIQAWMRKIPVVALNSDPDDIIKTKKIGFHSRNFEQLVNDVRTLAENEKLRNEMGEKSLNYAVNTFSMNNAKKFEDLLELW